MHLTLLPTRTRETAMARIRHIALTTKDPEKTAAFYMQAFGMKEVSRSPNGSLHLTDGFIDLAILNWKTEQDADVGPNGPNYSGIHHIGFQVDDMEEATHKLEAAQGQQINQRPGVAADTRSTTPRNYEVKWSGPDGVVLDVSQSGWLGAP
jgi:catechol 2,3-dioxygenase-like lactoylglutathione lyase family enzyme